MFRKSAIASLLCATAAVAGFVAASPASAATDPCPDTHYCFYPDANYHGTEIPSEGKSGSLGTHDQVSSAINNSKFKICVYDNNLFGDRADLIFFLAPFQDLSYVGGAVNDRADGWMQIEGKATCPQQTGKW